MLGPLILRAKRTLLLSFLNYLNLSHHPPWIKNITWHQCLSFLACYMRENLGQILANIPYKFLHFRLRGARICYLSKTRSCGIILNIWRHIPELTKILILVFKPPIFKPNPIFSSYVPRNIRLLYILPPSNQDILVELPHMKLSIGLGKATHLFLEKIQ